RPPARRGSAARSRSSRTRFEAMSPPESILAAELRAARPAAPAELRARVRELAAREPEAAGRRLPALSLRRAGLVLAPAVVVVALGAALAGGVIGSSSSPTTTAPAQQVLRSAVGADSAKSLPYNAVPPSRTRAQQ